MRNKLIGLFRLAFYSFTSPATHAAFAFEFESADVRMTGNIRKEWIRSVYNDVDEPYGLARHGKLGLLNLPEGHIMSGEEMARELEEYGDWAWGDVIAFDVSPDADQQSLIYLSHDGGTNNGDVIQSQMVFVDVSEEQLKQ